MRVINIESQELANNIAPEYAMRNDKVQIDTEDHLYVFSKHLADLIIEQHLANIIKKATRRSLYIKDLQNFYPSEYSKIVLTRLIYIYLLDNNTINIEGFLNFRANLFFNILKTEVEDAITKRKIEREYNEFIGLLRYFVAVSKPKVIEAHVKIDNDNFFIYDENENDITVSCMLEFSQNICSDDGYKMKNDDLLISSLIFLSPRRIFFSNFSDLKNEQLKKTIQDVFAEKLTYK